MNDPLPADLLRRLVAPGSIRAAAGHEISETLIGQPRASNALETGLGIKSAGFNIFVSGAKRTGKLTFVTRFLKELASKENPPPDWCYVNNFKDPYRPRKISLPTGRANEFRKDMKQFVSEAQKAIKAAFESEEFEERKKKIVDVMKEQREKAVGDINEEAKKENLVIQATPVGIVSIPLLEGKPMNEEQARGLSEKEKQALRDKVKKIEDRLEVFVQALRKLEKGTNEMLENLEKNTVLFAISALIKELQEKYDLPEITAYLDEVKNDIIENIALFIVESPKPAVEKELSLTKYEVNVLVDNSETQGAPIVIEQHPTFTNLFGKIEKEAQLGALITDFSLIKEGSLHKANGGYLIIPARELLSIPFSWDGLKRCLRKKEIEIEEPMDQFGFFSTKTLKPEPIPLNVKVILVDEPMLYYLLYHYDGDFKELFKIKADFDTTMDFNESNARNYSAFISKVVEEEKLLPADESAIAKIVEFGCRLAEDQDKLSTRFGKIADIIRESSFHAGAEKSAAVTARHISDTIERTIYRSNLVQEKIQEMIKKKIISIELEGMKTGQVNGLCVVFPGDFIFGYPAKITVSTSIGVDGIIDIEREVKLGGPIHSKGVMILAGYLKEKFGKNNLVSISASIVFEQTYAGVEGDSASCAELYGLLSSLAGVPVKQGIAVTGSVNQKGEVQAVGGINEKIEGFFEACRLAGFTGEQGIIIPATNARYLMLKEEVIAAVKENKFRIWAVSTIDKGIEILTGIRAGAELEDGRFEKDSIKFLVDKRFREVMEKVKEFVPIMKKEKTPEAEMVKQID